MYSATFIGQSFRERLASERAVARLRKRSGPAPGAIPTRTGTSACSTMVGPSLFCGKDVPPISGELFAPAENQTAATWFRTATLPPKGATLHESILQLGRRIPFWAARPVLWAQIGAIPAATAICPGL